ncbi:uncharacterized protein LOC113231293 isoform X3 [Hyposmocoma kahamanoa]|uniref:uncharacterized protein LOC113231293 isoform X3 n=1 Tax=Hyposmocoma kahamanoa TaxID=1477025 RepID=UPI000E6D6C2B|nr:uncharacterized protein LOC113231293 isoform X3 [Hyposmocoma kahamanoa]
MFIFVFFTIFKLIVGQHECSSFSLQPHVMGVNENYEKALQSYLQPIRKLAEDFPEHKVEVQLEIIPATSSRTKPTSKRILYMRKIHTKELPLERRELPAYSDDIIEPEAFINRNHQADRRVPILRSTSSHAELTLPDYQSAESITASSSTTETWLQHSSIEFSTAHAYPQQHAISLPNLVNAVYNARAGVTHTTKRPVYMEDLKKVLDDFEKKMHVMHAGLHTTSTTASSSAVSTAPADALEDAKRPVLKKDLWMALGMKYMTECQHNHNMLSATQTTMLRARIRKDEVLHRLHPNNSYPPKPGKLERIMSLLKKGVNVDRAQPKSADGNLQWLQIKIPKNVEHVIKK